MLWFKGNDTRCTFKVKVIIDRFCTFIIDRVDCYTVIKYVFSFLNHRMFHILSLPFKECFLNMGKEYHIGLV